MKVSFLKLVVVAVAVAGTIGLTSCNRGYGCPSDFSVEAYNPTTPSVTIC